VSCLVMCSHLAHGLGLVSSFKAIGMAASACAGPIVSGSAAPQPGDPSQSNRTPWAPLPPSSANIGCTSTQTDGHRLLTTPNRCIPPPIANIGCTSTQTDGYRLLTNPNRSMRIRRRTKILKFFRDHPGRRGESPAAESISVRFFPRALLGPLGSPRR